jgi:hypothetical protein
MLFFRTLLSFLSDKEYRDLLITTTIIIAVGSVVYHYLEGWTWIDCIYFSVITLSTIGYGDFSPATTGGKLFTIFYIVIGIGIILSFINAIYNHYNKSRKELQNKSK